MKKCIQLLLIILLLGFQLKAQVIVQHLLCENVINPVGIDIQRPQLSWKLQSAQRGIFQTAYEIIVSSQNEPFWKSGKVLSSESINISYSGPALYSGIKYMWKVRVWDNSGKISKWSEPASWSMAFLKAEEWKAKWIGIDSTFAGEDSNGNFRKLAARYLRKEFNVKKTLKSATAYISGLGLYELHINGEKTGDRVLAPASSEYNKTIYYNTFDVTSQLKKGKNAVGVIIGNGRYFAMRGGNMINFGFPKLLMQIELEYKDGSRETISSDGSWKITVNGPIIENNEYDGEKYDSRLEMTDWDKSGFNDSNWMLTQLVAKPTAKLKTQINEPIRVTGHIKPISLKQSKSGAFVFDMGQNMAGWASLSVVGKKGEKVTLRFGEKLDNNGNFYTGNLRTAQATDSYIFKQDGKITWEPKFTIHGFRYVELTGIQSGVDLNTITGCIVNDDLTSNGSFECSNEIMNKIYKNAEWGIRGNYRSFPTDCPQRDERMGWLGDRATGCKGESYIFNNGSLYQKWMGDIRDSQTEDGKIPDVCPTYWKRYGENITWDGTGIMITDMLYNQFGNISAVTENYDSMKKWLLHMYHEYAKDGLMPRDTYGDWCIPPEDSILIHSKDPKRMTDNVLLGTSFFYHDTRILQRFAKLLGNKDDEKQFDNMANEMKISYNNQFYVASLNYYGNNSTTSNILSLAFDLVPEDKRKVVFDNLVERIETVDNGHIAAGLIGVTYLQRVLTENGRPDLAVRFASQTTYPGWGYMADHGATTIWELWNGNTADPEMNSGNHVMLLGDLIIWMYENVGGIKPAEPGFKSIVMKPLLTDKLTFANTSHNSPYGKIVSNWKVTENNDFEWNIEIPANTNATIYVPANTEKSVTESFQKQSAGTKYFAMKDGYAIYEIQSGVYHFVSNNVNTKINEVKVSKWVSVLPNDSSSNSSIKVKMECKDKNAEIRYTLDDSTPTENSVLYSGPFDISKSSVLQTRSYTSKITPGYVTRRIYDIFDKKVNGLNFEYFEGNWQKIPDYNIMKPLRTGKVNGFNLNDIKVIEDYWGVRFKGFIEIPQDGIYRFSSTSDDGSRLFVNGQQVIDNDGVHSPFSCHGKIELRKGKYPIMLDYFEGNYGEYLKVEIEGPGITRQPVPVSMLYFE